MPPSQILSRIPASDWPDGKCFTTAAGFAWLSGTWATILLIFLNISSLILFTMTCAQDDKRKPKTKSTKSGTEMNDLSPAQPDAGEGSSQPVASSESVETETGNDASSSSDSKPGDTSDEPNATIEPPPTPPPAYTSDSSHNANTQRSVSPLTFSEDSSPKPEISPESQRFLSATPTTLLHLVIIIIMPFVFSRALYCPHTPPEPSGTSETFSWLLYSVHILTVLTSLGHWLSFLGDLWPKGRRPFWAETSTPFVIVFFPIAFPIWILPMLMKPIWKRMLTRVEGFKEARLRDEEGGVALGGQTRGEYARVPLAEGEQV